MNTDVLIVGAGPTGLMLAGWLIRLGIRPLVIDHKDELVHETRALGVQARTLETYEMLGLAERALEQGFPARGVNFEFRQRSVGHIKLNEMGKGISPYPYVFVMSQEKTERLLLDHYREHGGQVLWKTELIDLRQDGESVSAELRHADGHTEMVRAKYVCGCDGAGSMVRHALGIDFPGGTYSQRFFVADVIGTSAKIRDEISVWLDKRHFLAFFPMMGQDHYRVVSVVPPELVEKPDLCFEDVRPQVECYSDLRVSEALWFSSYNVHHRVANAFRRGRAFLLGDAGHIHSPVGGQGMNTGLMDASNLGWKLAAVLKGEADERLLASYEPERIPFAKLLVNTTDRVFTVVNTKSLPTEIYRAVVLPIAFRLFSWLPMIPHKIFGLISQTQINYRHSPISQGQAGRIQSGDRLPWVKWSDGASNYDALRLLHPQLQVYGDVSPAIEAFAKQHPEFPLTRFAFTPEVAQAGFQSGACYLLRPDGYVAYASPQFNEQEFLTFLHDAWGWQGTYEKIAKRS